MTENDAPELKPCPFCGGTAIRGMLNVWCDNCLAETVVNSGATTKQITAAWNTRADLAAPTAPAAASQPVKPIEDERAVKAFQATVARIKKNVQQLELKLDKLAELDRTDQEQDYEHTISNLLCDIQWLLSLSVQPACKAMENFHTAASTEAQDERKED